LQGINQYKRPVLHLFIGAVVKVISAYILIGIETINIDGAAYSTLLAYLVAAGLNLFYVYKAVKPSREFVKKGLLTLLANIVMILSAKGVFAVLNGRLPMRLNLLVSIAIAVVVYGVCIYFGKVITKNDFDNLGEHE
jgi:stage V sporulation protein B